jgi:hypothetical protein
MILGEQHEPAIALNSLQVEVRHDGTLLDSGRSDASRVDDPYLSLARVTRELHACGLALEPGQRLITGSITPSVRLEEGRTKRHSDRWAPSPPRSADRCGSTSRPDTLVQAATRTTCLSVSTKPVFRATIAVPRPERRGGHSGGISQAADFPTSLTGSVLRSFQ